MAKKVNVALFGTEFMGKAHSNAFRQLGRFFKMPVEPVMKVIVGRDPVKTRQRADEYGWEEASTDWKAVMARDDIDVVDIATPGHLHHPMVLEAAKAGKHIICEKPLANTVKEAKEMMQAAKKAGVKNMCGFSYRFTPAIATIKNMLRRGELGEIYHFRGAYQQDWIVDPDFPLVWRLQKKHAGSGTLGDIGAHTIDMCQNLVGDIAELSATMQTFVTERPIGDTDTGITGKKGGKGGKKGKVDVDDAVLVLARFKTGNTLATFEATRFAPGRRNHHTLEIYGSKGSLCWDLEHMNYFQYYNRNDPDTQQGFRLVHASDGVHPYMNAWWPPGHIIGYEHLFTHELYDFFNTLNRKTVDYPTFEDGYKCQAVLDTIEKASKSRKWEKVKS
ncbi:MAG: Gfo/Idh/MocA family oxidoreductase [Candidatus Hydrogenedentes bacterium]|nr:Gfo/Idh/MocA family oxidoreductase [Candidatus Hydrogenedentota bacterium]